ncbi:outer membrane usher protein [Xenorhabdus mauleonii]|uniref:Outer membrane usher protein n=1 Tax=Xenorhabdus mauleonii TaxID=351675 RepID=A0A1I3IZC4_9GAMM|nr:fimbria/pilus outer membrane usher protein [Xenorhabdus mauleonii]PHM46043.1 outer membrane usher protein [Xenorhabdus mauleonii]SFI53213.1 outer membrane usher protein [Xenorhabdus mauleonii]
MPKHIKHNLANRFYHGKNYRFLLPALIVIGDFSYHITGHAEDKFNIQALKIDGLLPEDIDLSIFKNDLQPPGNYLVDVYLNTKEIGKERLEFIVEDKKLKPKLTVKQWQEMGVKLDMFPALADLPPETVVTDIGKYIPDSSVDLDFNRQQLIISIPQIALNYIAKNDISPKLWDQGLTALMINYHYTGSTNWQNQHDSTRSNFLNLASRANWQSWRFRNEAIYSDQNKHWQSTNTYLQRDIHPLKGQLTIGDSFTSSRLFSGLQFRGVKLASDENMLPDSQKGFAPVVRGIAQSNAQVTIKQNGYVIYQTYVPPGAFEINDLYPTTTSGDLEIIVKEADGRERVFTQAFTTAPIMLREGNIRYSLAMGRYRTMSNYKRKPYFFQGELNYGLHKKLTAYGGTILSHNYQSALLGTSIDLGNFGALSTHITHAWAELPSNKRTTGLAYGVEYTKSFSQTGTYFTVADYRYATKGFYDFAEANRIDTSPYYSGSLNKKNKLQLQINQSLGDLGGLYISASQQDYWKKKGHERSVNASYNVSYEGINYSLSYSYSMQPNASEHDQLFSLSVSIPLERWLKNSWASYGANFNGHGHLSQQINLNGTMLADNNLSYSLQQSYANKDKETNGGIHANYKGNYGQVSAGYNYQYGNEKRHSQQLNYGINGGIVIHPYGLTLSQEIGETAVLVRAKDVKDIKIANHAAVTTDWNGYAVVPYASSYRKNRVALEPHSFADDVDIEVNTQSVVPTKGALVLADFQARVGNRVLMYLFYRGKPVPFGATVMLEKSNELDEAPHAIVSSEGQVYLTAMPDSGKLRVQWGGINSKTCMVNYILPEKRPSSGVYTLDMNCE